MRSDFYVVSVPTVDGERFAILRPDHVSAGPLFWFSSIEDWRQRFDTGDTNQQEAETDGQGVTLVRLCANGFGLDRIHQRQDEEVEHAAPQHIAECDVR